MIKRTYVYPATMIVNTKVSEGKYPVTPYRSQESYSITEIPDRYDTDEKKYLLAGQALISAFKETERFEQVISVSIEPSIYAYRPETFFIKALVNIDEEIEEEIEEYVEEDIAEDVGIQFQSMEDLINYVIRELTIKDRENCFEANEVLVHGNIVNNDVMVWGRTDPVIKTDSLPFA